MDFIEVYRAIAPEPLQERHRGPSSLLDAWSALVETCKEGYSYGFDEFMNDIAVRDVIESLCTDDRTIENADRDEFYAAVEKVDEIFRPLLQAGVEIGPAGRPWWRRGVLTRAGEEYAADMAGMFGVHVERACP